MTPLANRLLAVLVVAIVSSAGGAYLGYRYADNACQAEKLAAQDVVIEEHDDAARAGKVVERETVRRAAKTEAVFNDVQQGVVAYVQTHPAAVCSLDADGLRLWNAANQGADPAAAGERDATVPGVAAGDERDDDGPADQSHRGRQGVSPVPGSAPGLGGMAGDDRP